MRSKSERKMIVCLLYLKLLVNRKKNYGLICYFFIVCPKKKENRCY